MRRFLWLIPVVIVVLLLGLYNFPQLILHAPEPVRSGELTLPGLESTVTVYFDEYAVPHV